MSTIFADNEECASPLRRKKNKKQPVKSQLNLTPVSNPEENPNISSNLVKNSSLNIPNLQKKMSKSTNSQDDEGENATSIEKIPLESPNEIKI